MTFGFLKFGWIVSVNSVHITFIQIYEQENIFLYWVFRFDQVYESDQDYILITKVNQNVIGWWINNILD